MPELNICDKIELLTDEYFHEELSPEDRKSLEEHLIYCEKCAELFENEKIYFENIKSAGFVPEINIAKSVMNIIISEQRTADNPAKKRFIPFGLISAAAIVLVIFIASRDTLNLFKNTVNVNDSSGNIKIEEDAEYYIIMSDNDFPENNMEMENAGDEAGVVAVPQIRAMFETEEDAKEATAEDIAGVSEELSPAAASAVETVATISAPSEIIKIKRSETEDFNFTEYIFIGKSVFITKEYKDYFLENLKVSDIYFEIENTGIESNYIEIIYID